MENSLRERLAAVGGYIVQFVQVNYYGSQGKTEKQIKKNVRKDYFYDNVRVLVLCCVCVCACTGVCLCMCVCVTLFDCKNMKKKNMKNVTFE